MIVKRLDFEVRRFIIFAAESFDDIFGGEMVGTRRN
jgi:hypothetical protein